MKSLKVNDKVKVIAGDFKGQEAKIVKIDREKRKACLENIGISERHLKKTQFNPQGGKKEIHFGIDLSNLELVEAGKTEHKAKKSEKKVEKGAK